LRSYFSPFAGLNREKPLIFFAFSPLPLLPGIPAESAAHRNNSFSIAALSPSLLHPGRVVRDEGDMREELVPSDTINAIA